MQVLDVQKLVGNLPSTLAPNTFYAVRVGVGYDLYLSDSTGAVAHKLNTDLSGAFVGGRNLVLDSGVVVQNGSYPTKSYTLAPNHGLAHGDDVVITIWGQLADTKTAFYAYNSGGMVQIGKLDKITDGVYQIKTTWKITAGTNTASNTTLNIYPFNRNQTGVSRIDKIKLERGTIATDWTPAPEDTQAQIDELARRISALESKVVE